MKNEYDKYDMVRYKVKQSNKQIGNFGNNKEIALGQLIITLLKHEESLPDRCSLTTGQGLKHVLILPDSLTQQLKSNFLSTSPTKHHKATHPHLINVDVQQLPAYMVSLVVKIEKCSIVSQHVDLLQSILLSSYLRLFWISMLSIEDSGNKLNLYSNSLYFSSRIRDTK